MDPRFQKPKPQREKKEKCKLVIKKKGYREERSIEGNCTAKELEVLSGGNFQPKNSDAY